MRRGEGDTQEPEEWGQLRAGLGLTLLTHLQLPQVTSPGERAELAAPVLQQE